MTSLLITILKHKTLSMISLSILSLGLTLPAYGNTMNHLIASASDPTAVFKDSEASPNSSFLIHKKFLGAIAQNRTILKTTSNGLCYKLAVAGVQNRITTKAGREININMRKAATFLTNLDITYDAMDYIITRKSLYPDEYHDSYTFETYYDKSTRDHRFHGIFTGAYNEKHGTSYNYKDVRKKVFNYNLAYVARMLDKFDYCADKLTF